MVNGVEVAGPPAAIFTTTPGPVGSTYPDAGTFFDVTATIFLNANDTFQVVIRNDINVAGGNDFALDNIVLENTPTTVPEPLTLSLFGAGLAGAAALRRRRKMQKA